MKVRLPILGVCLLAVAALLASAVPRGSADAGSGAKFRQGSWRNVPESHRGRGDFTPNPRQADRYRLFSAESVWNEPVAASASLDPSSEGRVAALADLIESRIGLPAILGGGYPNIAADEFSTTIYRVGRKVERVPVRIDAGAQGPAFERIAAAGVPIPPGARQAEGSDGHMTIYQPASDTLWEFWRAEARADGWHARWGGAMRHTSSNPGYYSSSAWNGLRFPEGWNWGSTATSLPVAAGTVTTRELARGRIDHALAAAVPSPCRDYFSWPAQRTDGTSSGPDCMPQGAHLRLDPALDVDALGLHPVARMLAQAAQTYGIVVRDRTRVSLSFFLESPRPGRPSPYTGPGGFYEGAAPWQVLEGFPWRSLQLLPMSTCAAAPCRPGS